MRRTFARDFSHITLLADSLDVSLATNDVRLAAAAATEGRAYGSDRPRRAGERQSKYATATDPHSLAALGARLAELRA